MSKGGNMADSVKEALDLVSQVKNFPQSMVVIAGSRGSGKTRLAKRLAEMRLGTYVNLSLTLSRYLLTVNSIDDLNWTADFMAGLLSGMGLEQPLIFDNIEAIFQPELCLKPLSWFLQIAREVPLVVVWPGTVSQGEFAYSIANRPDYFLQRDLSVVVFHVEL